MAENATSADLRTWDPSVRRTASLVVLGLAVALIVACIVVYTFATEHAGWFLIVAIVALALLLLFKVAQIVIDMQRTKAADAGYETGAAMGGSVYSTPPATGAGGPPGVELRCPECSRTFVAPDTGERPLTDAAFLDPRRFSRV